MEDQVKAVMDTKIRPYLAEHFGNVSLVSCINGIVRVKFEGACKNCPSANVTLEDVVKKTLTTEVDGIVDVIAINEMSKDILDMAKLILNRSKTH